MTFDGNTDPRVFKRVQRVLNWCKLHLHGERPTEVHNKVLTQVFGPSGNKWSKFLRDRLLFRHGTYMNGVSSFKYTLNVLNFNLLEKEMKVQSAHTAYGEYKLHADLKTLEFKYNEKSDRFWHPLQNIKREQKQQFWTDNGLPFDYDIEACAPTVLFQLAERFGLNHLITEPIKQYLANKDAFRQHVAVLTGCSLPTAKRIINSLFNGAKLARNGFCSAYKALDCNYEAMTRLQEDQQVKLLRFAIKQMWNRIQQHTQYDLKTSRAKWSVYFKFEKAFVQCITMFCLKNKTKLFTEHDGFRTNKLVDKDALIAFIKEKTGFDLKISGPMYGENL